jgi:hypothetical protein
MSDHPVEARAFPTTSAAALQQELLAPTFIAVGGVSAILLLAAADAAMRGPWLDEFWTLELSDTHNGWSSRSSAGTPVRWYRPGVLPRQARRGRVIVVRFPAGPATP